MPPPPRAQQRTVEFHVGGTCAHRCPTCDCRDEGVALDDALGRIEGGGARLTLRGTIEGNPAAARVLAAVQAAGFAEVVVRTTATAYADPGDARALRNLGVDAVVVPLWSQHARVHDLVTAAEGSLAATLVGMRALAAAGLAVEVEVPVLPSRLQSLRAVVELAHRAVPTLRFVRFFVPDRPVPSALAPPPLPELVASLADALDLCAELDIATHIARQDCIPFCTLRDHPRHYPRYRFDPNVTPRPIRGCDHPAACDGCALATHCPGVSRSYSAHHGALGIAPWAEVPTHLGEQRTTPSRILSEAEARAAEAVTIVVMRPTVHCNQDCQFCSANETSNNVWSDPETMLAGITRAAEKGVQLLSFGGGEPTLSRHLPQFVAHAAAVGIPRIELVTNAVLLDSAHRVRELVDAGVTDAFVSLHGHDEVLSSCMTQKVGDFDRTVAGIANLLGAGVAVILNHVIGSANYRYLERFVEFVRERFDGRVSISFAYMTPQYKALTHIHLVPRYRDAIPYLKRAIYRGIEIGQDCLVGSRQGVPPCMLQELQAWSDVFALVDASRSEDQHQKSQGPDCGACRYRAVCFGIWKPYAARYGFDELQPVPGRLFTPEEVEALGRRDPRVARTPETWLQRSSPTDASLLGPMWERAPGAVPTFFDRVPDILRMPDLESLGPPRIEAPKPATGPPPEFERSRPLRLALLGTGARARRLAVAADAVAGIVVDAVASPHAPAAPLAEFGSASVFARADEALDELRVEAVVVAAATHAHAELADLAIARHVPVLIEQPVAHTEDEAIALAARAREAGVVAMVAHAVLFAPGVAAVWRDPVAAVSYQRRAPRTHPAAPRTWNIAGLYENLYPVLALVGRAAGGGVPDVVGVRFRGDTAPVLLRAQLRYGDVDAELGLEFGGARDEEVLDGTLPDGAHVTWRRSDTAYVVERSGVANTLDTDSDDVRGMLDAFRLVALGQKDNPVPIERAVDVMRATRRVLEALEAAGAPLKRPEAPKHVASREFRMERTRREPAS